MEQPTDTYYRARVLDVLKDDTVIVDGVERPHETLNVVLTSGPDQGKAITVDYGGKFAIANAHRFSRGQSLVLARVEGPASHDAPYYVVDAYRLPFIGLAIAAFFFLVIVFGKWRGLSSIVGLILTIGVVLYFIFPTILSGYDAFRVCVIGAVFIVVVSLYLSHGFNRRTSIAVVSSLVSLGIATIINAVFVHFSQLTGAGSEDALFLQMGNDNISLQGLLLGGIILGVLGVLDDVTTGQSAAVEEIFLANPSLGEKELFKRGFSVGREHIASLVNTLVLAYVGASFPLLLLYTTQSTMPLWALVNSSFISEEIVRTLVGSVSLVLAVPLTTYVASKYYGTYKNKHI